jgi:hypothetical protein
VVGGEKGQKQPVVQSWPTEDIDGVHIGEEAGAGAAVLMSLEFY